MLEVGNNAPLFSLPDKDENNVSLESFKGQWVVLYFYPKDSTPGCTQEACDFTASLPDFTALNAVILGVSPDSPKSHRNFAEKKSLEITLLSDPEHDALEKYGVWQLKKNYGREYMGVVRSTFIIDPEGKIAAIWSKVRVKEHIEAVKSKLEELQK